MDLANNTVSVAAKSAPVMADVKVHGALTPNAVTGIADAIMGKIAGVIVPGKAVSGETLQPDIAGAVAEVAPSVGVQVSGIRAEAFGTTAFASETREEARTGLRTALSGASGAMRQAEPGSALHNATPAIARAIAEVGAVTAQTNPEVAQAHIEKAMQALQPVMADPSVADTSAMRSLSQSLTSFTGALQTQMAAFRTDNVVALGNAVQGAEQALSTEIAQTPAGQAAGQSVREAIAEVTQASDYISQGQYGEAPDTYSKSRNAYGNSSDSYAYSRDKSGSGYKYN